MSADAIDIFGTPMPRAKKKAVLAASSFFVAVSLSLGSVVAQPTGKRTVPPGSGAQPGADAEIIVKPPAEVDPRLAKPAPPSKDSSLIERPPSDATPGPGDGRNSRKAPSPGSRQDDCRGTAEACRRSSPR